MKPLLPFERDFKGMNLVEASAGTGKTYNIVWLYLRYLLKEGLSVGEILVVTYTKAATKELKERLIQRIREAIRVLKHGYKGDDAMLDALDSADWLDRNAAVEKLDQALRSFDRAAVYTIHSFCNTALEELAFESRTAFDMELLADDSEILQEVIDDYWRNLVEEAEDDDAKAILLLYLIEQNLTPDELVDCLRPYTYKPYLRVIPDQTEWEEIESQFRSLQKLYIELQQIWTSNRDEIIALLDPRIMAGYTKNNLEKRIGTIDEILLNETSRVINPDKVTYFKYYTQSYISENLVKKAREKGVSPPEHRFFRLMDEYGDLCRELRNAKSCFLKELLRHVRQELPVKKQVMGVQAYDDLLLNVYHALNRPDSGERFATLLRQKFPVALVDEFQDTDPVQYAIFRSIYKDSPGNLFMIGDPKQAIYSFRGADIYAYLKAREDIDGERQFGLSENFRSVPELLSGVNFLFSQDHSFVIEDIQYHPVSPGRAETAYERLQIDGTSVDPLQFITLGTGEDDLSGKTDWQVEAAEATASDIRSLLDKGGEERAVIGDERVKARDIAVLVRTHRQADLVNDALAAAGTKSVRISKESVFHTREAQELEQVLAAIAEPGSESLIRGALVTTLIGKTANDLYAYEEEEERWIMQVERFSNWNHDWQEHGFAYMFRKLVREEGIAANLVKHSNGERRLTNILHLGELLQQQEEQEQAGMRSLIKWIARKRTEKKDGREEEELRLESDEDLVKIVTMHSSKGLEYPVVFCPFLWDGLPVQNSSNPFLYHQDEGSEAILDLTPKNSDDRTYRLLKYYKEELAESLRLAYVAITRAEKQCNIYWHAYDGNWGESTFSPLGYLLLGRDIVVRQIEDKLKLRYAEHEITGATFQKAVNMLKQKSGGQIAFREWKREKESSGSMDGNDQHTLQVRTFTREKLISTQSINSFSSLTRLDGEEAEIPDYDQYIITDIPAEPHQPETRDMFGFPRGPQPGTCVHKIFEQIDFSDLSGMDEVISAELETYDINSNWCDILRKNLMTIIDKPLLQDVEESRLKDLSPRDFLHEMEFYFDMKAVSGAELMRIIRGSKSRKAGNGFRGFMKGYIDLTVRFGDRFYIIDYKTNYLGSRADDYATDGMREEILESDYDLQYHIYTVALDRYLKKRVLNYSYENHFGGVLYLFIRGINGNPADSRGIYFDRPESGKIKLLDRYLKRGGVQ